MRKEIFFFKTVKLINTVEHNSSFRFSERILRNAFVRSEIRFGKMFDEQTWFQLVTGVMLLWRLEPKHFEVLTKTKTYLIQKINLKILDYC